MSFQRADSSVLAALKKFDTPTICNVLDSSSPAEHVRLSGWADLPCYPKLPPMVGYACTATFRAGSRASVRRRLCRPGKQVEAITEMAGPAVVVFQDIDDPVTSATFGEVMCTTYKAFGAAGLITSGAGRDLDQVEVLNFPCFTNGTICSHGYCQIVDLQTPVRGGRSDDLSGRPASRRSQRREHHSERTCRRRRRRLPGVHGGRGRGAELSDCGQSRRQGTTIAE